MTVSLPPAARRGGAPDKASDVLRASRHPLDPLFRPQSVAVIGATEKAGSVGRTVLWNLISSPFGGTVFPINPKRSSVLGIKAYPSLAATGEAGRPGGHRHARRVGPGPGRRVRRGRRQGRDHHLGRLPGDRPGGRGARSGGPGRGPRGGHPGHRAQLPGRDEPHRRSERHVRGRHGRAGLGRLHQPERRAADGGPGLERRGGRRLQLGRLARLDARRGLGRPHRLPGRRPGTRRASSSTWRRSAMRGPSCRPPARSR